MTKRTREIIVPDSHMLTINEGSEGDNNDACGGDAGQTKREEESVTLDTTEGDRPDKAVKATEHSAQRQAERS